MFNNHLVITAGFLNSSIEEANLDHYIYRQAVIRNPTDCIYDENGNYVERPLFDYFNPVGLLNEYDMMNETRNMRWHSTINLTPIENWNIKLLLSSEKQIIIMAILLHLNIMKQQKMGRMQQQNVLGGLKNRLLRVDNGL